MCVWFKWLLLFKQTQVASLSTTSSFRRIDLLQPFVVSRLSTTSIAKKMPSKKKKYNARFPAGRIKKIMQTDDEVGKVAQAVPVIISRTLELFVESLITKTMEITTMKNARTLSPHHMKQCIIAEKRFDFLKDLVKSVPEATASSDTDDLELPSSSQSRRDSEDLLRIDEDEVETDDCQSGPSGQIVEASTKRVNSVSTSGENGSSENKIGVFKFYNKSESDDDYDV